MSRIFAPAPADPFADNVRDGRAPTRTSSGNSGLSRQNSARLSRAGSSYPVDYILLDIDEWARRAPSGLEEKYLTAATAMRSCAVSRNPRLLLSRLGLRSLPACLWQMTHLKLLDIGFNPLHQLPDDIGNLTELTHLLGNGTGLIALPASLGRLKQLEVLDVSFNWLRALPAAIGHLQQLKYLYLHSNPLINPPPELARLPAACTITFWQAQDGNLQPGGAQPTPLPGHPDGPVLLR